MNDKYGMILIGFNKHGLKCWASDDLIAQKGIQRIQDEMDIRCGMFPIVTTMDSGLPSSTLESRTIWYRANSHEEAMEMWNRDKARGET